MRKATIDLREYPGPELVTTSQTIHDAMVTAAAIFDKPPTTMDDFQTEPRAPSPAVADLGLVRVRTPPVTKHTNQQILSGLAAFPLVWLALLYLFVVYARVQLGHWPSVSDGMAKHIFTGGQSLIVYALYGDLLAVVAAAVWAIALRRRDSTFSVAKPLIVAVQSGVVCAFFVAIDPGAFILWVID